jgi:hypothetical protein
VAEFVAAHAAAKEIMWTRSLLAELGYPQEGPTTLYEDNKSTIHMIYNDCNSQKTKHIDIRFNLIREQVKKMVLAVEHLPTKEMISDMLTKALPPTPYLHLRPQLLGETVDNIWTTTRANFIKAFKVEHKLIGPLWKEYKALVRSRGDLCLEN